MLTREKVVLHRERRGWTQADLARRLGYKTHHYIGKLERGERTITKEWRERLAAVFGIAPDELLDSTDGLADLPPDERGILEQYRLMTAQQQQAVQSLVKALREP